MSCNQGIWSERWFSLKINVSWPGFSNFASEWLAAVLPANRRLFDTLKPEQNGQHFADNILRCYHLKENIWILIGISLNFLLRGSIDIKSALIYVLVWQLRVAIMTSYSVISDDKVANFGFYPRPVLAFGYCHRLRLWVCVSVCVCVCSNHELVRTITHRPFKLGSPNLDQRCKTPWFGSLLFLGMIDLDLQGQI